jgi:hypothetical protein
MGATWVTKYGLRRVRVELPTLEDALFAAEGLTPDVSEQIHIAADLMQLPFAQARAEAERIMKDQARRPRTVRARQSLGPVVVERRTHRRALRGTRD